MPAVASPSKVLVSGANGYIAAWVVRTLLEKGYAVRGTVRSEAKGAHLKKLFAEHGDKFEVVVVEDITKVRRTRPGILTDTALLGRVLMANICAILCVVRRVHSTRPSRASILSSTRLRRSISTSKSRMVRLLVSSPSSYD